MNFMTTIPDDVKFAVEGDKINVYDHSEYQAYINGGAKPRKRCTINRTVPVSVLRKLPKLMAKAGVNALDSKADVQRFRAYLTARGYVVLADDDNTSTDCVGTWLSQPSHMFLMRMVEKPSYRVKGLRHEQHFCCLDIKGLVEYRAPRRK